MRYEACDCGGEIVAVADDSASWFYAVWRHNRRPIHRAWRRRNER